MKLSRIIAVNFEQKTPEQMPATRAAVPIISVSVNKSRPILAFVMPNKEYIAISFFLALMKLTLELMRKKETKTKITTPKATSIDWYLRL